MLTLFKKIVNKMRATFKQGSIRTKSLRTNLKQIEPCIGPFFFFLKTFFSKYNEFV
jgi:hypothetical protein